MILFSPKESLYFLMEENAKKFGVIISNETLNENMFSLDVENLELSMKGIQSATAKRANISLLLLFNSVELHDIELSSLVDAFIPLQ
ncbi:MAG: hypothetical protein Q9M40_02350 [Sulfurimonas sp.]|nr:hypothetical protein [Sulfurimonas sp.]